MIQSPKPLCEQHSPDLSRGSLGVLVRRIYNGNESHRTRLGITVVG